MDEIFNRFEEVRFVSFPSGRFKNAAFVVDEQNFGRFITCFSGRKLVEAAVMFCHPAVTGYEEMIKISEETIDSVKFMYPVRLIRKNTQPVFSPEAFDGGNDLLSRDEIVQDEMPEAAEMP